MPVISLIFPENLQEKPVVQNYSIMLLIFAVFLLVSHFDGCDSAASGLTVVVAASPEPERYSRSHPDASAV